MNNAQAPATKQDIKIILEAIKGSEASVKADLTQYIDEKTAQVSKDLHTHMGVLVEDAEERFLKTAHDTISLQTDTLNNHETRLTRVEQTIGF